MSVTYNDDDYPIFAGGETCCGKTEVDVTQILDEGTKIATISVDDVDTDLYAPEVDVTQILDEGTKIATISVGNVDTDLYAPNGGSGSGVFVANFVQDFALNTITCDKTNAEILAAISNGIPVLATYSTVTEPHEKQYCCGNYSVENARATFQFMKIYYDSMGTPKATDSLYLIEITWVTEQNIWQAFGNGYSLTPVSNP